MANEPYPRRQAKHSHLVDNIVRLNPGVQRGRFWADVRALADEMDFESIRKRGFVPDAHHINRDRCCIEIHEAVNTHPPMRKALLAMGALWFDIDCEGTDWTVELFLHRADQTQPAKIDLAFWYLNELDEPVLSTAHPARLVLQAEAV